MNCCERSDFMLWLKRVRDIMCMTRAKCMWLLQFDFTRLRKIPPKVCVGCFPLFSVLAFHISAECQSKGMDEIIFFTVAIQPHGVSLHTSTTTQSKYSTWLQGTSIMQHRFEQLFEDILVCHCQIANGISFCCLSVWNVLIQFNSFNLLWLGLSSAVSRTACHVL